ncbi:hypothetical protein D3C71_643840 [compost metagenome]
MAEHRWHGHEGETRAGCGVYAGGSQRREDHQPRQHRDKARQGHYPDPGAQHPFAIGQIGAIGGVYPEANGEGEEGQPQGIQHALAGQHGEVRQQQLAHPGHGPRHGETHPHQQHHHDEERRHHPAQRPLHSLLNAPLHEPPGEPGEDQMSQHRPPGMADVAVEQGGQRRALAEVELARHSQRRIAHGPAPHHAVEAVDEEAAEDPHVAHPAPVRPHQPMEGAEYPALAAAAEQGLTHQHRDPQGEAEQQKHQQEGAAAIGGGHIGKLPDGAKANGRAGRRQHMTETGRPLNLAHTTSGEDNIESILHG